MVARKRARRPSQIKTESRGGGGSGEMSSPRKLQSGETSLAVALNDVCPVKSGEAYAQQCPCNARHCGFALDWTGAALRPDCAETTSAAWQSCCETGACLTAPASREEHPKHMKHNDHPTN